jgi:hypothetical protein
VDSIRGQLARLVRHREAETVLIPEYTRGVVRADNPAYEKVKSALACARRRGDRVAARELRKQLRRLPSRNPRDPGFQQLHYTRYADDHLLGFTGPKAEAEQIKSRLAQFLRDDLKLELNEAKTLITHARTQAARFLGYEITVQHANHTRRTANGVIGVRVPKDVIKAKCAPYMKRGKPAKRPGLVNHDTHAIITTYGAEYRGLVNYLLAGDVYKLNRVHWVMRLSLLKTLACKYNSTVSKMASTYRATIDTPHGPRTCLQTSVERHGKKPLTAPFGRIPLKRQKNTILHDCQPTPAIGRKELISRLLARRCEMCQHTGEVDVHHVGKLAHLDKPGQPQPAWAETHRQTTTQNPRGLRRLPRPHPCPATNRDTHGITTEEPDDRKRSRPVREGAVRKRTSTAGTSPDGLPHRSKLPSTSLVRSALESHAQRFDLFDRAHLFLVFGRLVEVDRELAGEPELRAGAEGLGQPQGRRRCDAALAVDDLVDADVGHADPGGELGLRDA